MTARAARAFLPTLRKVERQLSMPVPARVRILRELEYDLEEFRSQLEAEGLPAEDARARSLDALVPDGGALRELGRLHTPLYRRLTGHLAEARVRLLERSALAILTISVLVAETWLLLKADLFSDPSPYLWPVLGLGAMMSRLCLLAHPSENGKSAQSDHHNNEAREVLPMPRLMLHLRSRDSFHTLQDGG